MRTGLRALGALLLGVETEDIGRLSAQVRETVAELSPVDGRLHTTINQTVASTGRLSTTRPNLQAIPIRTELGREIRSAFIAEQLKASKARIDEIREQTGTVFLVSHSLAAIQQMCTRVLWIHDGELRMDGPTDEVCEAYAAFTKPKPAKKK